ncbi:hypothetical protein ACH5RR_014857 [Cinchona calisaya]|uniref:Pentatricopeptide repeat-containing protein n=1 Tax=Cinchona calisaya TaxID=153742 RepID=A0ABD2ZSN4_9GENT
MALRLKLRSIFLSRHFSTSILNPNSSKNPQATKQKSRAALSLLRTENNPERILEICRSAQLTPESHLDRNVYSEAISKLKGLNYFNGIRAFFQESMARPDMKSERFVSHFMVLYGQAGMVDDARKTFEEMPQMGFDRTVKTLNALLFSCVLAKDHEEMKRVYMEFPVIYGIVPNLDTYNTVIKGFCESGDSSSCFSILAEMSRKGVKPNATTFGAMIAGFYEEGKFEDVGKALEMMKEHGVSPGISIYNTRIKSLCKLGRSKEAKALFEGILSRGYKPNNVTYNYLIHGFCKEGDLEEAKRLFERMVRSEIKPDGFCYFTLVYFLCKGEEFEAALKICRECLAKGWVPNFTTMKLLVEGLASISKVNEAKEIIRQLKEKFSLNADKWTEIEKGLAK